MINWLNYPFKTHQRSGSLHWVWAFVLN